MLFNPAIERLPLPQLRALQDARLREQVAYVYERVPFYRHKFDALGVHPRTGAARVAKKRQPHKRQLILDEAARLFKERSFDSSSMRDLGARVGLDAASMYNHLRSKDEILDSICFRVSDAYLAQLTEVEQMAGTYLAKITELLRQHVRLVATDGAAVSVANNEWKALSEPPPGLSRSASATKKAWRRSSSRASRPASCSR
ncbi:MAG: TetR family transcriptional regulator [Cytophagaceae bacterium]|nr:MAG: TetR family transcriptional regulator [Cytophagaceae bacterium]